MQVPSESGNLPVLPLFGVSEKQGQGRDTWQRLVGWQGFCVGVGFLLFPALLVASWLVCL